MNPPYNPNDPNNPYGQYPPQGNPFQQPPNQFQQPYQQPNQFQNPYQQNPYQGNYIPPYNPFLHNSQMDLPNAQNAQVCGIVGLILFWNVIGLVLNICAMSMGSSSIREAQMQPGRYTEASLSKAKAAKTCGIVGVSLFGFALIVFVLLVAANS